MKTFAKLYAELDATTTTNAKIRVLKKYFQKIPAEDAIWAIRFLIGKKPKQIIPTRKLREWAVELAEMPSWLFEECYHTVGDLSETITLLLPPSQGTSDVSLHVWIEEKLLPLRGQSEERQKEQIIAAWRHMNPQQRFVWNKLITGGFRVGVSEKLVVKALAAHSGIAEPVITHRLKGDWEPTAEYYQQLITLDTSDADISRPYPFYLAYPLEDPVRDLGPVSAWQVEWKWDGIRAQMIKREGQPFLWSRGEELMTDTFPELREVGMALPDGTALDGEIVPWRENKPLNFAELQKRVGRKNVTKKILQAVPVRFIAFDLLEYHGKDVREELFSQRQAQLLSLIDSVSDPHLDCSREIPASSWAEFDAIRKRAREEGVEGFMLKRLDSPYRVGRKRGDWWKWQVDPLTVDAVLIYAQGEHGRRSSLSTDYTFAVWHGETLVPFAKAYSGLTDAEIREVDRFIKQNTIERFGPVRSVQPELVFEIAFEGIQKSPRHKSGVAVRFPRISRWRRDKKKEEADTLETLRALLV
jgi:DNA ligase-1